jgi:hypothetical protein
VNRGPSTQVYIRRERERVGVGVKRGGRGGEKKGRTIIKRMN